MVDWMEGMADPTMSGKKNFVFRGSDHCPCCERVGNSEDNLAAAVPVAAAVSEVDLEVLHNLFVAECWKVD